jgi:hypothetical protein
METGRWATTYKNDQTQPEDHGRSVDILERLTRKSGLESPKQSSSRCHLNRNSAVFRALSHDFLEQSEGERLSIKLQLERGSIRYREHN